MTCSLCVLLSHEHNGIFWPNERLKITKRAARSTAAAALIVWQFGEWLNWRQLETHWLSASLSLSLWNRRQKCFQFPMAKIVIGAWTGILFLLFHEIYVKSNLSSRYAIAFPMWFNEWRIFRQLVCFGFGLGTCVAVEKSAGHYNLNSSAPSINIKYEFWQDNNNQLVVIRNDIATRRLYSSRTWRIAVLSRKCSLVTSQ